MQLETLIQEALSTGASDLHLEVGMPRCLRIRGSLRPKGAPLEANAVLELARETLGKDWTAFTKRRSADLAKTIRGVRCRIHVMQTLRGIGMAIRLFARPTPTIDSLNLHPELKKLATLTQGLVLICGPTGSGKSSTAAALLHEASQHSARHILTLESPIEFLASPGRSLVRQREIGTHSPSFERGLLDALREDPDVLFVGELRDPETMRLTLNAAETGHLVFSTLHSASVPEALHRLVAAFPSEIQTAVCAQLADCLRAVVCQTLVWREDGGILVPECEILRSSTAAQSLIRQGQFQKLRSVIETAAQHGMFTRDRYRRWLDTRTSFHVAKPTMDEPAASPETESRDAPILDALPGHLESDSGTTAREPADTEPEAPFRPSSAANDEDVIVIQPPEQSLADLIRELEED